MAAPGLAMAMAMVLSELGMSCFPVQYGTKGTAGSCILSTLPSTLLYSGGLIPMAAAAAVSPDAKLCYGVTVAVAKT